MKEATKSNMLYAIEEANKYSFKRFIMALEIFAAITPGFVSTLYPGVNTVWKFFFLTCLCYVAINYFQMFIMSRKFQDMYLLLVIFGIIILSTFLNDGRPLSVFNRMMYAVYGVMVVYVNMSERPEDFIYVLRNILLLWLVINLITVFIYPDGMYDTLKVNGKTEARHWFLGFKNGIPKFGVILIAVSSFLASVTKRMRDDLVIVAAVIINYTTSIMIESSSGIVGTTLVTVMVLIFFILKKANAFRMRNLFIAVMLVFLTAVVTDMLLQSSIIAYIVEDMLGKNMTLTNRTSIWASVFSIIRDNLLLGVGLQNTEDVVAAIDAGASATDAHDFYLEYLMEGGIFCFIVMLLFIFRMVFNLDKNRQYLPSRILSAGLFSLLIIFITENSNNHFMWMYFGICLALNNVFFTSLS